MHKITESAKPIGCTLGCVAGAFAVGGFLLQTFLPKMPMKKYTAACLYLAVMDDEICRNELEGSIVNGTEIVFPSKIESLQYRYHLFLKINKRLTSKKMSEEIKKFEDRLAESRKYVDPSATTQKNSTAWGTS